MKDIEGAPPASNTSRKRRLGIATALTVFALLFMGAAPAFAWGSSSTTASPSGCWGGFAGSSSKYASGGNTFMYASVGAAGSGCFPWASYSLSARWNTGPELACATFNFNGCNGTIVFKTGRTGGFHEWGSAAFNT